MGSLYMKSTTEIDHEGEGENSTVMVLDGGKLSMRRWSSCVAAGRQ
jgi:hypothetical protein